MVERSVKTSGGFMELVSRYIIELDFILRDVLESQTLFRVYQLEEEVKKKLLEELRKRATELSEKLKHISDEEIAALIREDRDSR